MKKEEKKCRSGESGFDVVCGIGPKNEISVLDLGGANSLLITDLDYFVEHHEKVLELVKGQIEKRDYFREHPEELEGRLKRVA